MNLYRDLPCVDYDVVNTQMLDFILSTGISESPTFWNPVDIKLFFRSCPNFFRWAAHQELMIESVAITVGRSERPLRPHRDTPPARYKLSWPIANSDMTWNRWFAVNVEHPDVEINELGGLSYNDINDLKEIGRRRVDRPGIIDAGVPHDVWYESPGRFPRLGLQCKLRKEPESL